MADKIIEKSKKEDWEKDMVWIKFINLERKGEQHTFTVNGRFFTLKHGEVSRVPRAVVWALNNAVNIRWKVEDHDINGVSGKKIEKYEDPRMSVQELTDEQAMKLLPPERKSQAAIAKEIISKQTSKQSIAAEEEDNNDLSQKIIETILNKKPVQEQEDVNEE